MHFIHQLYHNQARKAMNKYIENHYFIKEGLLGILLTRKSQSINRDNFKNNYMTRDPQTATR